MLYLASASSSRKELLDKVKIPYKILNQYADEQACDWSQSLKGLVTSIAEHKMAHVRLPEIGQEGERIFVLTADTLGTDSLGEIQGKPVDRVDAIEKIKNARKGGSCATAFCLDRKNYVHGKWIVEKRLIQVVAAEYLFDVPDAWIESYLSNTSALSASGAITIEDYGMQFLKMINGSYSTIVGLPVYEVRQALEEFGFFSK